MLAWCVQALTPLTIGRSNIKATLMGALWGFGHSIGQLILGLLMVLLKVHQCFHDQSMPEISSLQSILRKGIDGRLAWTD